jgi:hypothetical protein
MCTHQAKPQMVGVAPQPQSQSYDDMLGARELLSYVLEVKAKALEMLKTKGKTPETARMMHDALLACCSWGWLPPMRPSCIRTITNVSYNGKYAIVIY